MAVGLAVADADAILTAYAGGAAYNPGLALWVELRTGDPGVLGLAANVAGNATRKLPTWAAASGGVLANSADIVWNSSEVDTSEDYTHVALWSASTSGTFRGSGLVTAGAVVAGNQFRIPAGDLVIPLNVTA